MSRNDVYGRPDRRYTDAREHPGLVWRLGGRIAANVETTFRSAQVADACATAAKAAEAGSSHGALYKAAFDRREAWLKPPRAQASKIALRDRLFIGMGDAGVYETQANLHPVHGLPRLPASAIKGCLRAWCEARFAALQAQSPEEAARFDRATLTWLFGSEPGARKRVPGAVVLHDAWWVPGSTRRPLIAEIDTPHHPAYYAGAVAQPSDMDDPSPNPQLAVGGAFLFGVDHAGIGAEWAAHCMAWLQSALAETGLGGRLTAGYGRFAAPASEST